MPGDTHRRYPSELKERAVRMVAENVGEHESQWAAMTRVAELLGVGTPETVRKWVRQAQNKPRRADRRWSRAWSPEQIAHRLPIDFPDDEGMRISHEAIYQALYIEGRGALKR